METESLKSEYPEIAKEWHPTKNGDLSPEKVKPKSNKVVWWLCPKGHEYEQTIDKRTSRGYGCSYCSGKRVLAGYNDLMTVAPSLAGEWNYEKNNELLPTQVTLHSNKWAWWKCQKCGYEWKTKINARANGSGCPVCSKKRRIVTFRENRYLKRGVNDLATLRPDLTEEWDKEKNGDRFPYDFTSHSKEKVWWKCSVCGNEWEATIYNRADNNSGCPKCKKYTHTSFPEQALLFYIKQVFPSVENRYTEIFKPRKIELDIFVPEIHTGIEYDGKAWHKGNGEKEREKYEICKSRGIRLIRVAEELSAAKSSCDVFILRADMSNKSLDIALSDVIKHISDETVDVDTERDRSEIFLQYITYIRKNSIAERSPWAAEQWDTELNGGLTPWMINAFSNRQFWWRCEKGHAYKMNPANKTGQILGCPYCSGHRLLEGFNDLQTRFPKIAEEWDYDLNAPLKAKNVMPGSIKKYWWRCKNGHSYSASPTARTSNDSGCPICAGKSVLPGFNDLETTYPDAAAKWDYEKNVDLTPQHVLAGSKVSVWWKCPEGHSW
ncbi:MAG: zinc-ribbon domain-containing protein, partial [Clostridia bacterium]|nr:zinc-ribbon domain-containing protein [Clostridia bacterium]